MRRTTRCCAAVIAVIMMLSMGLSACDDKVQVSEREKTQNPVPATEEPTPIIEEPVERRVYLQVETGEISLVLPEGWDATVKDESTSVRFTAQTYDIRITPPSGEKALCIITVGVTTSGEELSEDDFFNLYSTRMDMILTQAVEETADCVEVSVNGGSGIYAIFTDAAYDSETAPDDEFALLASYYANYSAGYVIYASIFTDDVDSESFEIMLDAVASVEARLDPPETPALPWGLGDGELTESAYWINLTFALLTLSNGGVVNVMGGYELTEENIANMVVSNLLFWRITDKDSCDAVIADLLETGHRTELWENAENDPLFNLDPDEFREALDDFLPGITLGEGQTIEQVRLLAECIYDAVQLRGEGAILAWDYCRAIQLYCTGYVAGYYTYDEALDNSLDIALELQSEYSSWEEMYRDYLVGYYWWSSADLTDPSSEGSTRTWLMELLLELDSEIGILPPWDMELVADWR